MNGSRHGTLTSVRAGRCVLAAPYLGNPVAVILDADDLDTDAMQRVARWTNLSETTFVLTPASADADCDGRRDRRLSRGAGARFRDAHVRTGHWSGGGSGLRQHERLGRPVAHPHRAVPGSYRVSQGQRLGRAGDIRITAATDGSVWVGGATNTLFRSTAIV
ncbi:hypothetical protein GCM10009745_70570 [Kribbella yunnanensis]|uniref:PhzF family phenazine biosynthesis protein n=1 Tax=Kribbella yunnanensis TaxID=190194 RepID=A0ABN2IUV6_9ACTN